MSKKFKMANAVQKKVLEKLVFHKAIAELISLFEQGDGDNVLLGITMKWRTFATTLDNTEKLIKQIRKDFEKEHGLDYAQIDEVHICASAILQIMQGSYAEPYAPYCEGVRPWIFFGQWMIRRDAQANLNLIDDFGEDLEDAS